MIIMKKNNLCIIPARGGSKRIPRKNIKEFFGKPIIAYSIEIALKSNLFNEVMVSTDCKEIARIAKNFGAKIPFYRSKVNSDDISILDDVVKEVVNGYKELGKTYDNICCIMPIAPLLEKEDLIKGLRILIQKKECSVKPVLKFKYPIQRALKKNELGLLKMINPENYKVRSQDLEISFHDSGQFYWLKPNLGLNTKIKYGFEISSMNSQDVDDLEDWNQLEMKYHYKHKINFTKSNEE